MKCIVMFSGGLDSTVAVHLLRSLGLDVLALHFVLPFESGIQKDHSKIREYAAKLNVPLQIVEEGEEFLEMMKNPDFGFGKNVNPCVDCRIHRINKTKKIMEETGAGFIATGEVLGQRPMSQQRSAMMRIEKKTGLNGLLLRPLSAKLLDPTVPEIEGWVNREKLFDLKGRSRTKQMAYAKEFGLTHGSPGGGCLLTEEGIAARYDDLVKYSQDYSLADFKLLAYGRHFRISPEYMFAIGRHEHDNNVLEKLALPGDDIYTMVDCPGPTGVGRGNAVEKELELCASITARYAKLKNEKNVRVAVRKNGTERILNIKPIDKAVCSKKLIRVS